MPDALQLGDNGPEVAELQQLLVGLGYQIQITGSYDEDTYEAVKGYQQYCCVEVTGAADANTLAYLQAHASTVAQGTYEPGYDYEHADQYGHGYDA